MEPTQVLEFEKPVLEVERELLRLRSLVEAGDLSFASEVEKVKKKLEKIHSEVYSALSAYDRVQLSRHPDRPFTLDYVRRIVTEFVELKGDRVFGDDPAIVGGIGKFNGRSVVVVGHQRGRSTQERILRNFGMSRPEGNRKAQRLFRLAEKFKLPLLLFIDTQGAYPGLEAEARGQAESIAMCLHVLSGLKTPIISTVIGEGGSGGALALGVSDRLLMLENSTYSVITPEGCAAILWGKSDSSGSASYAKVAADALKLTAKALIETGVVDDVIREPVGGAHRDHEHAAEFLGQALARHLSEVCALTTEQMLERRYEKYRRIGALS